MADVVTEEQLQKAREMLDQLLGNRAEAEAYSEDPQAWVEQNGYEDVPAEAVAACGVGGGAYASASSGGAGPAPAPGGGVAGTLEQVDYVVYNYYSEDNSITNNIANNGFLDFEQNIDQTTVEGDGNIVADDGSSIGQAQTGDGQQAGDGGVNIGEDAELDDTQIQTGDGIQADGDVDISGNVETGEGDQTVDQSVDNSVDDHSTNIDDHSTNIDDHSVDVDTNVETDVGLL